MEKKSKTTLFDGGFGKYVLPGILLQSVLIGGGYATGREVISYGAKFGAKGWIAGIAILIGFSIMSIVTFEFVRVFKTYNYKDFMKTLIGKAAILYDLIYIPLVIIILAVMASATGEIVNKTIGLNYWVGVIAVILAVGILNFYGTKVIEKFETYGTVALYAAYIIFGVLAISKNIGNIQHVLVTGDTSFVEGGSSIRYIIWTGIVYVAYNLIVYPASFASLKRQTTRKESVISGIIAGVLMTVPWFITYFAFMGYYPQEAILASSVPWLDILYQVGGTWTIVLFGVVMGWTLIETSTGVLHAFVERVNSTLSDYGKETLTRGQSAVLTIVVLVIATVFSKFGIIDLIAKGYEAMSYGTMIVYALPLLTIGIYKIVKESKNKQNTEDTEKAN